MADFDNSKLYAYDAESGDYKPVKLDASGDLIAISAIHHKVHAGKFFYFNAFSLTLGAAANLDMLLVTGTAQCHIRVKAVLIEGDGLFTLYKTPTTSANGTEILAINANQNSENVPTATAYSGPTVTGTGTLLGGDFVKIGNNSVLANFDVDSDLLVLEPETTYLLRLTNRGSGATEALITLGFYEV